MKTSNNKYEGAKIIFPCTDFVEKIKELTKEGYFSEEGEPLKCVTCKGTGFEDCHHEYDERGIVEYSVICKECNTMLGHWSYGQWGV